MLSKIKQQTEGSCSGTRDEAPRVQVSSMEVFTSFVEVQEDGTLDAERLFSKECYQRWLETRQKAPKLPEESFRRAITAHVRGINGRKPFTELQEQAVLKVLRRQQRWPCFNKNHNIGKMGYQKMGFHEERKLQPARRVGQKKKRAENDSCENDRCKVPRNIICLDVNGSISSTTNSECPFHGQSCSPLAFSDNICFCNKCVLGRIKTMDYESYMNHLREVFVSWLAKSSLL